MAPQQPHSQAESRAAVLSRSQSALDVGGSQPSLFAPGQRAAGKSCPQRDLKSGACSTRWQGCDISRQQSHHHGRVRSNGIQHRSSAPTALSGCSDWPGLFQEEQVARKAERVNGAGVENGNRSKASTGIAWRGLPGGYPPSVENASGCGHISAGGLPMPRRKVSQFSPRHNGAGMKGTLSPVDEQRANLENSPPSMSDFVKEMCPFYRDDLVPGAREFQPATHHRRDVHANSLNGSLADSACISPLSSSNCGISVESHREQNTSTIEPYELHVGEKCIEARRDWSTLQQNPQLFELLLTPQSTMLTRTLSQRSVRGDSTKDSILARSLSTQTVQAVVNPVHSVRPRPSTEARARWK